MTNSSKGRKVLVVEDEGLIARDISSRLEALGHEVIAVASTAKEAVEHAAGADVVLMDIHIDGRADGIDAATEIREKYRIPVVFLTAHADRATLDRAKIAEPFGYIVKPMAQGSLNTSIEIAMYKHRMERQLEEREAWLRTILSSIADAAIVTDTEGRVSMMNHAAETLTGALQPEVLGQPIAKVAHLVEFDREDGANDPVTLAILRDSAISLERNWKLIARNGRELLIEGSAAPIRVNDRAIGVVLSFRDVSVRRWEERQIRQTQKMEAAAKLAAGVATDYSNLLAIVRNQAEQLLVQFGEYTAARKAVEEIRQAAAAAEQLNRRLAAFGTRQVSQPEVISVNAILRKAVKLIESIVDFEIKLDAKPKAKPAVIGLAIRPMAHAGKVKVDAAQIEQAMVTLVVHACGTMQSSGNPGTLLIETGNLEIPSQGRMQNYVMLAISYTGEEPEPERLFEPAAAADESLSLSMVHSIVAEHGGLISAQATAGGGTRFEMLLPRHEGLALVPRPIEGPTPVVLLVDERDRIREQLHNYFEANGFNLLEAATAAEAAAVAALHEGSLDLLIAEAESAAAIEQQIRAQSGSAVAMLRIVKDEENGPEEIRRPFTQQHLIDKVTALLRARQIAMAGVP